VDSQKVYPYRFQNIYGPLTEEKKVQVRKLIQCGKFQNGFQRYTCPNCETVLIVPFSCKSRLCLSCARKRLFDWSFNLSKIMNNSLKHTHVTFIIPGQLCRILFDRRYESEKNILLTAGIYKSFLQSSACVKGREYQPGILATFMIEGPVNVLSSGYSFGALSSMEIYRIIVVAIFFHHQIVEVII